jgi:arabinogalactan oligomer/maltooligosaccharide transport system substrate-binding protein
MVLAMVLAACAPAATATPPPQPTATTGAPEQATATSPATQPEATATTGTTGAAVKLVLWTKEGEADGGLQWVKKLTDQYTAAHPNVTFEVVNKDVETLREDFQTTSLAGNPPDLLWTVNDHAGPFVTADLIQPVDSLVDTKAYVQSAVDAVSLNGKVWGIPISNGNHLMLMYNKALVPTPPANTDELISMAKSITKGDTYGFVFNQTEPFWLVPWLGGFGGAVFSSDGKTPTLNTPEMTNTLKFLHDIKYTDKILPKESDGATATTMFKEGKAGMIIDGDWALADYRKTLGDNFGVAPIPEVSSTSKWPAPYTSGVYFMIPKSLSGDKLQAALDFAKYVSSDAVQLDMVKTLSRLPAVTSVLNDPSITGDPILAASAKAMTYGTAMPPQLEMRCNWDAMKPEMNAVLADQETADQAAQKMQAAAESCIQKQQ